MWRVCNCFNIDIKLMLCLYKDSLLSSLGTIIFYLGQSKNLLTHFPLLLLSCSPSFIQQPWNFKKQTKYTSDPIFACLKTSQYFPFAIRTKSKLHMWCVPWLILWSSYWYSPFGYIMAARGWLGWLLSRGHCICFSLPGMLHSRSYVSLPQTLLQFSDFRQHFNLV